MWPFFVLALLSADPQPLSVKQIKPIRREMRQVLRLPASLTPTLRADPSAPVTGWVRVVSVDVGYWVKRGQLLATVEPLAHGKPVPLTSPVDGEILRRDAAPGSYVQVGAALFTIVDISAMRAQVAVPEDDSPSVRLGQPAILRAKAMPGREYRGAVDRMAPEIDAAHTRVIAATFANPDHALLPGMTAQLEIEQRQATVLAVPREAVGQKDGAAFVYCLDGNHARRQPVTTGMADDQYVEIVGGVGEGQVVIVGPGLIDGATVVP
jgi:multidrug efflux pump subunit AcrA (membrane-fusion protein)